MKPAPAVAAELALEESERGFRINLRGLLDPKLGPPWSSLGLVGFGMIAGWLTVWSACLPFFGIALALLSFQRGSRVYGLQVDRGKLVFIGAETVPLHTFDRVEALAGGLRLVGPERSAVLDLEGSAEALGWTAERLSEALRTLGDEQDVPVALAGMQRENEP